MRKIPIFIAWLIAILATLGSLHFGEGQSIEPCRLCWYQRIAMYPLTILIGMIIYREDTHGILYTLPFVLIGLLISIYQTAMPFFESLRSPGACGEGPSCSKAFYVFPEIPSLNFITLPMLSCAGFIALLICLCISKKRKVV